jgi:hypothetical protein
MCVGVVAWPCSLGITKTGISYLDHHPSKRLALWRPPMSARRQISGTDANGRGSVQGSQLKLGHVREQAHARGPACPSHTLQERNHARPGDYQPSDSISSAVPFHFQPPAVGDLVPSAHPGVPSPLTSCASQTAQTGNRPRRPPCRCRARRRRRWGRWWTCWQRWR